MKNKLKNLHHSFIEHLNSIFENLALENIDDILEGRDDDQFSELWTNAYNEIKNINIQEEVKIQIDEIRKAVYILTYQKTNSSDLAAYISDDIDLIAMHYLNKTNHNWAASLHATYLANEIPQGVLKTTDKNLEDLIN